MRWIEYCVSGIASSELEAVVTLQLLPLNPFAVYKRTVLAVLIDNEKTTVSFVNDQCVVARDPRISNHQILIDLAAHREGGSIENEVLLFVPLNQHERRKDSRTGALRISDGTQTHGQKAQPRQ